MKLNRLIAVLCLAHGLGAMDANHRVTCMDEMQFDDQGYITPIKITTEGVDIQPLASKP